ncbi:MAG: PD40 domain-containing protein, partial [Cytophagia bacterium]|nr:PD40 domain-containing protein [Cytophagia bacterium]
GGFGGTDMYISFRNKDGSWKRAINMGKSINSKFNEFPSGLTPDGKYFIFASSRMGPFTPDIYWVSSKVIENLK